MEYSMRLEYLLAVESDTTDGFAQSQRSELARLRELADLLEEKACYVSSEGDPSAHRMVTALAAVVAAHSPLLGESGEAALYA